MPKDKFGLIKTVSLMNKDWLPRKNLEKASIMNQQRVATLKKSAEIKQIINIKVCWGHGN